jgi:Mrp family chromosome partitioning ATPase
MKHPSTDPKLAQSDRLVTIWSIIEARKSLPATIVVTGATHKDDTAFIARGLAQVAHTTGQRTGYLELKPDGRPGSSPAPYAALSIAPRGSQREAFDAALAAWRPMYDVVIVNAGTLGSEALGAHAARVSDGVVIGICDQRRVERADHILAQLLNELKTSVLGVVMTAPIIARQSPQLSLDRSRVEATA